MDKQNIVKTGIGVFVVKDNKVLLGRRKGSHGQGEWAFPGGHLEYGETFEECARREVREEAGIEIKNVCFQYLANARAYWPKQYTHVNLMADYDRGEVQLREPERCEQWQWFDVNDMPRPLFTFVALALESYRTGKNYFDGV